MQEIIKECMPTYEICEEIGRGSYGSVYSIKDHLKERAVKIVPLFVERSKSYNTTEQMDSKISRDLHAIREYYEKIKGDGVVEVYDFHFVDKPASGAQPRAHLVVVMELCPWNLLDYVLNGDPLPSEELFYFMEKLCSTLGRLYRDLEEPFLVTDLKPSNLLVRREGTIVIGDLGGLKRLGSVSTASDTQFSPNWTAPEVVLRAERPGVSAAVFSYGLVSYFMWEGCLPYEGKDFMERFQLIKEQGIDFKRDDMPSQVKLLISTCTKFSPQDRPVDFEEILKSIKRLSAKSKIPSILPGAQASRRKTTRESEDSGKAPHITKQEAKPTMEQSRAGEIWRDPVAGIDFVWVPGGEFVMGAGGKGRKALGSSEAPGAVRVNGFWIGRYPVTQGQWKTIMKENPSHFDKGADFPVEQVSWQEAVDFTRRLSETYGNKCVFTLPDEIQWEYAARSGGRSEEYSGGEDVDSVAWHLGNSRFSTHPVGEKSPNSLGIYDMSGNVMEFCSDTFTEKASVHRFHTGIPPTKRVCRGGAWNLQAQFCTTTARRGVPQGIRYSNLGFRVIIIK